MMMFLSVLSFAQGTDGSVLSGVIRDENGSLLQGITVTEKGTNNVVTTNGKGVFSIHVKSTDAILVLTGVGFEKQELRAAGQASFDVALKTDVKGLSDVVVVGYGTQKKANLTGAVAVVKGAELVNRPTATVSQALQGKVSGMNFSAGSFGFEPGAALNLQIRGQGAPLILIDGMYAANINGLNPNDIESVSVLKDAAAAAIYGARAPYGVVLITTKSGATNNKLSIEYSGNYSFIKPINMPHHLDSYTTALALNEAAINSGITPLYTNLTIDRILAYQQDPVNTPETNPALANPALWANTFESNANYDWFNVFYGDGQRYQHNLSMSGGNKAVSFFLSGGYVNDGGVLQVGKDNYKRYNLSAKFDASLTNWIKLTSNTRYYNSERNTPAYDNQGDYDLLFHQVARTFPSQYMKSKYGVNSIQSKIPWTKDAGNNGTTINDMVQRFAAEITSLKGWTINGDYTFDLTSNQFTSKNFTVYEDNVAGQPVLSGSTSPSSISKSQAITFYQSANAYTTYKFDISKAHHFSIMAGYQQEKSSLSYLSASKTNMITGEVPSLNTSTGTINATDNLNNYATEGVFGRFNYNFNDRYLLELNSRYDGTYKFAAGKKWGFFPSVSAGWNLSNEKFWEVIKPVVNAFKLRASFGSLGNQLTAGAYQDLPIIAVNSNLGWILNGTRPSYTSAPTLVNPDITWETSNTKNLGADLGLLKNRLTLTAEVYQRLTYDQLGSQNALPAVIGASLPQVNNMETRTDGWEFSFGWNDKIGKDFKYSVIGQLFDYYTTITKYNNPTKILTTSYEGQKQGEIWGYTSEGLMLDQATVDAINTGNIQKAISGQTWKIGDMRYADLNKDGVVNFGDNTVNNPGDRRVIGNTTPRYQYGVTLRAEWKGFDFSMFVQGVGKRDLVLSDNLFWGFISQVQSSIFKDHLDYFRDADATKYAGLGKNTDAYFARPYLDPAMNAKNQAVQTRYIQNGAYTRLKNIQLGYSLSDKVMKKAKLSGAYFYVSGENMLTISHLPSHFDPENANIGVRGSGKSFFPQQAITLGVNLKF
ncbi:hypothetical protein SY85_13760 [Flavisolibacter tropicus]|uniref:TonB-dependent receptor n=2 Tax=Flavisolibacter tropicus TaxID=1492898 RepID=A0A172TWC8_9BACT|nr:hypothetical protein SY85_13760 [Flavisolibacter tropicus]